MQKNVADKDEDCIRWYYIAVGTAAILYAFKDGENKYGELSNVSGVLLS
jgi:hypothetical protein